MPKLYHKALGFCIGTNPKTLYRPLKDRNKTLPKLDLYFNIPEDLVRVLFEEKLGMKIIFINELEELDEMLGK